MPESMFNRSRDKLTVAEICADLGLRRRTFYELRAGVIDGGRA
jgi:hypothetical protein